MRQFQGMYGAPRGGGLLGLLLFLLIIAGVVLLIRFVILRRRGAHRPECGRHFPPKQSGEMTREEAARVIVNSLLKQGIGKDEIRRKLIEDYQLDALTADAIILQELKN